MKRLVEEMKIEAGEVKAPSSRFAPAKKAERGSFILTERDELLLVDIFLHQVLDRGQLQELHFSSVQRCNMRLRKLFDQGYVARDFHPSSPYGSQAIYRIGPKAAAILSRRLEANASYIRQLCRGTKRPEFLEHTLAIADFYLAAKRAVNATHTCEIETWLPELSARHEYDVQTTTGAGWKKQVFKPDGFLRLKSLGSGRLAPYFVEVDRGNASAKVFTQKVDHYQQYRRSGLFSEMYGDKDFVTLVVTTGSKRLEHLKGVVEESGCTFFWFTTQKQIETAGLLSAIWQAPSGLTSLV